VSRAFAGSDIAFEGVRGTSAASLLQLIVIRN
jgi:hypothetical protein